MKRIAIAMAAALLIAGGCTDQRDALAVLQERGYRGAEMLGHPHYQAGCEPSERAFGFKARSPEGRPVLGNVCCPTTGSCIVNEVIDGNAEVEAMIRATEEDIVRRRARLDAQKEAGR